MTSLQWTLLALLAISTAQRGVVQTAFSSLRLNKTIILLPPRALYHRYCDINLLCITIIGSPIKCFPELDLFSEDRGMTDYLYLAPGLYSAFIEIQREDGSDEFFNYKYLVKDLVHSDTSMHYLGFMIQDLANNLLVSSQYVTIFAVPIGSLKPQSNSYSISINSLTFEFRDLHTVEFFCALGSISLDFEIDLFSYFIEARVIPAGTSTSSMLSSFLYFEAVPSLELLEGRNGSLEKLRVFSDSWVRWTDDTPIDRLTTNRDPDVLNLIKRSEGEESMSPTVCLYYPLKKDGQTLKMLRLINSLPLMAWKYFSCDQGSETDSIKSDLERNPQVTLLSCFAVSLSTDVISNSSDSESGDSIYHFISREYGSDDWLLRYLNGDENVHSKIVDFVYIYANNQLELADGDVRAISIPWVRDFWMEAIMIVSACSCDVLLFGNSRKSYDAVLTNLAKILGIVSIMDLPNLHPHHTVRPDIVIVESKFVLEHPSISRLLRFPSENHRILDFQICSGVENTIIGLRKTRTTGSSNDHVEACKQCFPGCEHAGNDFNFTSNRNQFKCGRCFTIGFVARLAQEKAPGLFLLAAKEIYARFPFVRFMIIGDGPLREKLLELSVRLGLTDVIHFTGWINSNELRCHFAGLDVLLNTGAWRETFGIANIEAMMSGIPLVTFAAGGVGEYVLPPSRHADHYYSEKSFYTNHEEFDVFPRLFVISDNAVVVMIPDPVAIAAACMLLIRNATLRASIALNGYSHVSQHFTIDKGVKAFSKLLKFAVLYKPQMYPFSPDDRKKETAIINDL